MIGWSLNRINARQYSYYTPFAYPPSSLHTPDILGKPSHIPEPGKAADMVPFCPRPLWGDDLKYAGLEKDRLSTGKAGGHFREVLICSGYGSFFCL
jgi:hypothetical protein